MESKEAAAEHAAVQDLVLARRARRGDREAREAVGARLDCVRDQLGAVHARLARPCCGLRDGVLDQRRAFPAS